MKQFKNENAKIAAEGIAKTQKDFAKKSSIGQFQALGAALITIYPDDRQAIYETLGMFETTPRRNPQIPMVAVGFNPGIPDADCPTCGKSKAVGNVAPQQKTAKDVALMAEIEKMVAATQLRGKEIEQRELSENTENENQTNTDPEAPFNEAFKNLEDSEETDEQKRQKAIDELLKDEDLSKPAVNKGGRPRINPKK